MLQEQYTEKLFGWEGVNITNVETEENKLIITLQQKIQPHCCPSCGTVTTKVHDYRMQKVRDLPAFGRMVVLNLRKRRYVCPCCQKRFAENNPAVGRYQQMTRRLQAHIIASFSEIRSAASIAREHGCSVTTAVRFFNRVSHGLPHLPEALSIDEFKGNAGGEKFQCILTNPKKRQVLDILPNRKLEDLCAYFNQFPKAAAKAKLAEWMLMAQVVNLEEFKKVITTISNWSKEFLNAFSSKLTNGFTEGMNNRTKVLKRTCYGVRNFERFRNRILYLQPASSPVKKGAKRKKQAKTAKKKAA